MSGNSLRIFRLVTLVVLSMMLALQIIVHLKGQRSVNGGLEANLKNSS